MSQIKFLILSLIVFISVSIYWWFYLSSILNSSFESNKATDDLISLEKKLLDSYQLYVFDDPKIETGEVLRAASIEDISVLRVLKTIPNETNHTIEVDDVITVIFSEFVRLEDLLWYIERLWDEDICPSWDKPISKTDKLIRCSELNKVFLNKAWEEDSLFEWTVKRSNVNDRALVFILNEPLDGLSEYILKISKWLEWFSKTLDVNVKLSEDKLVFFDTLQWEEIKKHEFLNEDYQIWTWAENNDLQWLGTWVVKTLEDDINKSDDNLLESTKGSWEVQSWNVISNTWKTIIESGSVKSDKSLLENEDDENIIEKLNSTWSNSSSWNHSQVIEALSGFALESIAVQSWTKILSWSNN